MLTRFFSALRRLRYPFTAAFRGRGEIADAPPRSCACGAHDLFGRPLPDPDSFDQDAPMVLAGSDLIDAQVPVGTGERMAREIETYLKEIQR